MKIWKYLVLAVSLLAVPVQAEEEVAPSADELLAVMREMTVSQGNKDVAGRIRKGRDKVPFSLSVRGETLAFQ